MIKRNQNKLYNIYPSKTYGIIESKSITISFKGKTFICNFFYIKSHNKNNKSEQIYLYGYIGIKLYTLIVLMIIKKEKIND